MKYYTYRFSTLPTWMNTTLSRTGFTIARPQYAQGSDFTISREVEKNTYDQDGEIVTLGRQTGDWIIDVLWNGTAYSGWNSNQIAMTNPFVSFVGKRRQYEEDNRVTIGRDPGDPIEPINP